MTDFFEPGFEYTDATPYTAPEIIRTFRCVAVATLPDTDMPLAFGFMHTNNLGWGGTGMDRNHWRKGWDRRDDASMMTDATATAPTEVWYYTDDDESASDVVYPDRETAQAHAVRTFIDYDSGDLDSADFTWQEVEYGNGQTTWRLLHHGVVTGWNVDRVEIAASIKAGA